jgi:RNA polymerase sigma-70 factor (ECF subfamily)
MLPPVLAGLDTLPEEQRSLLLLVAVEDLSYEDAARVTGVPVGTVMSRLSRARARLRAFVERGPQARLRSVT